MPHSRPLPLVGAASPDTESDPDRNSPRGLPQCGAGVARCTQRCHTFQPFCRKGGVPWMLQMTGS
jgi:hypothetical protein